MGNQHSNVVTNDETFGEGTKFKVHIKLYEGFDAAQRRKLREAVQAWVDVWRTEEFKNWVMNYDFQDTKLSNAEIYDTLIGDVYGANIVDNQADIEIWAQHKDSDTVVNTTFVHDGKQWEGSKYLMTYSAAKLAGYLAHEYCRNLHFLHIGPSSERSVPFAVGKKTKRMAENASYDFAENTSAKYFKD